MSWIIFVAGAVLGATGYRAWRDSMETLAKREAEHLITELRAEILRLRTQVSLHIGTT